MKLTKIYVKQSPIGLFYLGKTEKENHDKYTGSGTRWLNHLRAHKIKPKDIKTWILHETTNAHDLKIMGIYYSKLFNVIENDNWANLMNEEGCGGTVIRSKKGIYSFSKKMKNYITINKDHEEKRVPKEKIDYYYDKGWKKGISENSKNILSKIRKNKPKSEDLKKKLSESTKGIKKEQVICPHCKLLGGKPAMIRHHFNNCKNKKVLL